MLWRLFAVALLAIGLTTAIACGDDDDDDTSGDDAVATTAPADTGSVATETEPADDGGSEAVTIGLQAADFTFTPPNLTAAAGAAITLTVTNAGNASHSFTSDDLSIDETIEPGESKVIEFTFPDAQAEFHCKFHESQMTGSLIPQ